MNQIAIRLMRLGSDVWIVAPFESLWNAADANARLTILGHHLEGLRARTVCDAARMMRGRFGYGRIFLYGVRGGARTAELVNSLCDFDFERVAIDALPVPLDSSLAERFLELEISEVGLLQTVGPFWGLHAWIDFPLSARSPTVYLGVGLVWEI